jgi:hypothetical protein
MVSTAWQSRGEAGRALRHTGDDTGRVSQGADQNQHGTVTVAAVPVMAASPFSA